MSVGINTVTPERNREEQFETELTWMGKYLPNQHTFAGRFHIFILSILHLPFHTPPFNTMHQKFSKLLDAPRTWHRTDQISAGALIRISWHNDQRNTT